MTPTNIFEHKLEKLFNKKSKSEIEIILQVISLIFYNTQNNTDIIELYKLLDMNNFIKVVSLFDGRTVKFPTKKFLKNTLLLSLLYYYKEVENMSWEDIKKEFPFEVSSISYGIQIRNLNNFVKQKIEEILNGLKNKKDKKNES